MKSNLFIYSFISLALLFCFSSNSIGQSKINFSMGIGIPEAANVGVRYQIGQAQVGLSVGTFPSSDEKILSVSGGLFLHFGNITELSNLKPWYFMVGLTYMHDKSNYHDDYRTGYEFYLTPRIGREFNISEKVGIYFDLGLGIALGEYTTKPPVDNGPNGDGQRDFPVIPAIGLGVFFKL